MEFYISTEETHITTEDTSTEDTSECVSCVRVSVCMYVCVSVSASDKARSSVPASRALSGL
jgi:hypothetical protein